MDLHTLVRTSLKIGVFGSDGDHCTDAARAIAYSLGQEIARRNYVLFTGGGTGVMEAACRGAADLGGLTVGIIPGHEREEANNYCSLVIPTDTGYNGRSAVLVNAVDGAILVEGSVGTFIEALSINYLEKPVVALPYSGGKAADLAGKVFDEARNKPAILSANDILSAINLIEEHYGRR